MTETSFASMPVWIDDSHIDPAWIKEKLPDLQHVSKCAVIDISNDRRRGEKVREGTTLLLTLTSLMGEHGKSTTMVAKQVAPSGLQLSCKLGLAREAMFYNKLAPKVRVSSLDESCIPKIYYSHGDMSNGSKIVFMEDLSSRYIDSGIIFGPGNPNNWSRDLESQIADAYHTVSSIPTSFEVANQTFLAIAKVHATFWRDNELLQEEYHWLRGSSWISGKGEDTWWASQKMLQSMCEKYLEREKKREDEVESIEWDPLLRDIVEKAMNGISWESHLKRLNVDSHFCLVHGDFWPGNVMIEKDETRTTAPSSTTSVRGVRDLRLLDWEMVGLGSGPQDLGQYILSNIDPQERRECEEQLIRNYYEKLVQLGVRDLSWEYCWSEYTIGGLERWLWFLVYFCSQEGSVMLKWAQFFHNQMKEFVHDHSIRSEHVTQPRP
uniref:Aminoglycoside phosphotransferase domain-containing protein n=1 Tax=Ditylum brightwellii TaxID=49249 RepID=A0A7S4WHK3_9STRA|mmetsp:Transcript_28180/g.37493  ORF Transcript_28180/g.37493 Transcript_28180/m.37493 type:complete len:436 (+) Transcript_28180:158-1465(+)